MTLIPLILIPALYFSIALIKPYLQKLVPFNICAICIAVSSTWLALLPLFLLGKADASSLAILMGMSLVGIMYKLEAIFKKYQLKNFWFVRLVLVVGGFYLVSSLLIKNWNIFALLAVLLPVTAFIGAFFFQGVNHNDPPKGIKKRLEDCC